MAKEYIIYTDESERRDKYYSNFIGGALVSSYDLTEVINRLNSVKAAHNLKKN